MIHAIDCDLDEDCMCPAGRQILLESIKEPAFREDVVQWAHDRGWEAYFTWNSIHSPAGFPDLVLVKGEEVLFVELKTVTGRLRQEQRAWIGLLGNARRCRTLVWRPDMEEQILETLGPLVPSRLFMRRGRATTGACLPSTPARARSATAALPRTSRARASTKRKPSGAASKP